MDPAYIGAFGCILLVILLLIRVPVGIALMVVGVGGSIGLLGVEGASKLLPLHLYSFVSVISFTAIPLFLLMGYFSVHSGLASGAFASARLWLSGLPGGLAIATCMASAIFGATAGSGVAAAAALGPITVPEMLKYKYDKGLATGVVAAAAPIAVLIPPSVVMVIYSVFTGASLGRLLLAGYIPALFSTLLFAAMIVVRVRLNPGLAPSIPGEVITWGARLASLRDLWGVAVLVVVLAGGIYLGLFTPTEAAAVAAFATLVLMAVTGHFTWGKVKASLSDTAKVCGTVFLVVTGASVFSIFIALSGLPDQLAKAIVSMNVSALQLVLIIAFLYLLLGMLVDSMAMLLLTMPVLLPILVQLNVDLIWMGIIFVKLAEIGGITPPFGISVFTLKAVVGKDISLGTIFRGIGWFLLIELVAVALLIAFPQISLFLPDTMRGGG